MASRAWDRRRSKPGFFPHPTRIKLILSGPKGSEKGEPREEKGRE